jgi:hypothetical protein
MKLVSQGLGRSWFRSRQEMPNSGVGIFTGVDGNQCCRRLASVL